MPACTALISAWSRASNSPPVLVGAAAPGVVQHVGAIFDDIFQRLDAFDVVERAIVGDAVVEHPVAHHVGFGGHAAEGHGRGAGKGGLHLAARHRGGGVRTVRRAFDAGPGILVTGRRRIPGAEVDAAGDDLAVGVAGVALGETGRIGVAGPVEHRRQVVHAAVHRGELDPRAGVALAADRHVIPGRRRVDQREAGVEVRVVRRSPCRRP